MDPVQMDRVQDAQTIKKNGISVLMEVQELSSMSVLDVRPLHLQHLHLQHLHLQHLHLQHLHQLHQQHTMPVAKVETLCQ